MRQPQGSVRYGDARATLCSVAGRRRRNPALAAADSSLEERIDEIMDRVQQAGDDHAERAAALEEYLVLARAHEDEAWFDAGAWSEDLADSYLALGRVDTRSARSATRPPVAMPRAQRCCAS